MVTAELLAPVRMHPAQRRRIAAKMPPAAPHDVVLRPLGGGDGRTVIVTSSAQDCVTAILEELKSPDWKAGLDRLRRLRKGEVDGVLELNQPIHRRFQIALFEAVCDQPGHPRLDPTKVRSSGLVIRRISGGGRRGWMKRGKTIDGWLSIARQTDDPDPLRAMAPHPASAAIREAIAARHGKPAIPTAETIHGLYVAPPEVCQAVGRTVLFAVIPVSSAETSDGDGDFGIDYAHLPPADRADMVFHLSEYLKGRSDRDLPKANTAFDPDWNVLEAATKVSDGRLYSLGTFLQQAMMELDVLGNGAASVRLRGLLSQIRLPTAVNSRGRVTATIDAVEFVRRAGPVLIGREDNTHGYKMPLRWPAVSDDFGRQLCDAALACLSEQYKARVGPPGKFADDAARYVVRGFIRVAGHDDCPEKVVWSPESEPFRILPWWDGEGPGTTISLPDLGKLKAVKPSVSFAMPPAISNLLKSNLKDLVKGDGKKGADQGLELGWICSFSIPFITICAFIVLNIFLSLFDIIFRWMMFIKVCIPIPRSK